MSTNPTTSSKLPSGPPTTPNLLPRVEAVIYPESAAAPAFPEFDPTGCPHYEQYAPAKRPLGIAISGGGMRSLCAAVGQVRGLRQMGWLDFAGALSCVSGGSWFGSLFSFTPTDTVPSDDELLGPVTAPEDITTDSVHNLSPQCIGSVAGNVSNSHIIEAFFNEPSNTPTDRYYSRLINDLLLKPFGLSDTSRYLSLDADSVAHIVQNNPSLQPSDFYTTRPNRPYFIAGSTLQFPLGTDDNQMHFEYSPLYVGTPQTQTDSSTNRVMGGGYAQTFAFDTTDPVLQGNSDLVSATPSPFRFLLSDLMGSSGDAPAAVIDKYKLLECFSPEFNYWPVKEVSQGASTYNFVDGGLLENTGIVPLLRRQYPVIAVFANSEVPFGSNQGACPEDKGQSVGTVGIDGMIGSLFGCPPETKASDPPTRVDKKNSAQNAHAAASDGTPVGIQIFPQSGFQPLVDAFTAAKDGEPLIHVDQYTIVPDNVFGIAPYPDDGQVTVVWFYNAMNHQWFNRLDPSVQELLSSTEGGNYMANFPNYCTVGQNNFGGIIPEALWLSNQQITLLADMWCFTMMGSGHESLQQAMTRAKIDL